MTTWRWISESVALAIREEQLSEHGGSPGMRDIGLLQSALARPVNRAADGEADVFDLAAAYAFGVIRNHAFADGNKRTAFMVSLTFLVDNGYELTTGDSDQVLMTLRLADGSVGEEAFAAWLREKSAAL